MLYEKVIQDSLHIFPYHTITMKKYMNPAIRGARGYVPEDTAVHGKLKAKTAAASVVQNRGYIKPNIRLAKPYTNRKLRLAECRLTWDYCI
jgi:hypothetical protein